mmetsp:Transcript_33109/g.72247  ORF Transcript_33109/g.72247 Transcript_33109/m.72247 type:complete len:201 (+) Transcript_33109:929-1531(+)
MTDFLSTHLRSRFCHFGCSSTPSGEREIWGLTAMMRPTQSERDVWTRTKVPLMKRSSGALFWCAHVTRIGFSASSTMKANRRNQTECHLLAEILGSGGGRGSSCWSLPPCAAAAVSRHSLVDRALDAASGDGKRLPRSRGWSGLPGSTATALSPPRLGRCLGASPRGTVACTRTARSTSTAESVTGQKCCVPLTKSSGMK